MKKILTFVIFYVFFNNDFSYAHVDHYKNIKLLKFNLFYNNKNIGNHTFKFNLKKNLLYVNSEGSFKINKLGVVLIDYRTVSEEVYSNGKLISYQSKTTQNDKKKFVNIKLVKEKKFEINGSSFKGLTDASAIIGSWWNHEIVKNSKQISPISGRVIDQKVKFLGQKKILIGENEYNTLHFHFFSDNEKPMSEKKLNIEIWYDKQNLNWVKAKYEKLGKWEYRLIEVR